MTRLTVLIMIFGLAGCMGDGAVATSAATGKPAAGPHMGKPSVPVKVNVSHTEVAGDIEVTAVVQAQADIHQARFEIFSPTEVKQVSGDALWQGEVKQGQTVSLTARYSIQEPVAVYPLSWRALFSGSIAGMQMSMHGLTHYGSNLNSNKSRTLNDNQPRERAGSLEFKGQ